MTTITNTNTGAYMYRYIIGVKNGPKDTHIDISAHLVKDGTITLFNTNRDAVAIYSLTTLLYIYISEASHYHQQDEE
jgi:hypothetical protein